MNEECPATPVPSRPFRARWLAFGFAALALSVAGASVLTLVAQAKLEEIRWEHAEPLHAQVYWYLKAGIYLRILSLCLVIAGAVALAKGARRLERARADAEACAAELRRQEAHLKEANLRLFKEARIDALTKLQTRLRLTEDLEELWSDADRHGDRICAVMCDVDRFKEYNDGYGHVAGDRVLRRVADALLQGCRAEDRLYRYGGEEFLLLIRADSTIEALTLADRHRCAVEALAVEHCANAAGVVTVSMGLAPLWAGTYRTATEWIEQADAALYRAKRAGRNCIAAAGQDQMMRDVA